MEKTIKVMGSASLKAVPNIINIRLKLIVEKTEYKETIDIATEKYNSLVEALSKCNLTKQDIKTSNYNVNTRFENVRDDQNNYKSIFAGYSCNHDLIISVAFDMSNLSNILNSITNCQIDPNVGIEFTIANQDDMREVLLQKAVQNALSKAKILAKTVNLKVGEIISITEDTHPQLIERTTFNNSRVRGVAMQAMDIVPQDVELNEQKITLIATLVSQ